MSLPNKDLQEKTPEELIFYTLLSKDKDKETPSINVNKDANSIYSLLLRFLRKLKFQEIGATVEHATGAKEEGFFFSC